METKKRGRPVGIAVGATFAADDGDPVDALAALVLLPTAGSSGSVANEWL